MPTRKPLPPPLARATFRYRDGLASGLGQGRLRGPDLQRPFRGVRVAAPELGLLARAAAFQHRAADNTFICSTTAALLYGVPLPSTLEHDSLHVGVPSPARSVRVGGVVGHKFQIDDSDLCDWRGLRITTPERTWCDLATQLRLGDLVAAGDYILQWRNPLATTETLRMAMLRHAGRRGHSRLRAAFPLLSDRSESRQESLLRVIVVRAGISGIEANLPIRTSGGFHYRADLAILSRKFILEFQSRFHDGTVEFRADMTRTSRLEADEWYVMQVNWNDINNPRELVQRIRNVLSRRPPSP